MTSLSLRSIRQSSRFDLISAHIAPEPSTKVTWAAPREMASIPTAPEPAQRSRNRPPAIRGAITLKRVSRRRSEVGRTSREGGLLRFRPRYLPAIIRKRKFSSFKFQVSSPRENLELETWNLELLSHCCQSESRVRTHPFNQLHCLGGLLAFSEIELCFLARALDELLITNEVGDTKLRQS